MNEQWKDVKGWEGKYQISNFGRLKSILKNKNGKIRSVKNRHGWYLTVPLCCNCHRETVRIHRLVAEAFIPNLHKYPEVNHKDGNKQNNNVENLEWCTRAMNMRHAIKMNPRIIKNMVNYNRFLKTKTILQYNLKGDYLAAYPNAVEAHKSTGVCHRNILQVASQDEYRPGKTRKQAGGYVWKFKETRQCAS